MLKDYYRSLGIPPAADAAEIKAAYRALAAKYHPDKAGDNPFAESHFKEISEAYRILGDAGRRRAYDEERWLRGLSTRSRDRIRISPEWLLGEAGKLEAHMHSIDTYRMNPAALRDYVGLLLSDEHLSIWNSAATSADRAALITVLLRTLKGLAAAYYYPLTARLSAAAAGEEALLHLIEKTAKQKASEARQARLLPLFAILIACAICIAIILTAKAR